MQSIPNHRDFGISDTKLKYLKKYYNKKNSGTLKKKNENEYLPGCFAVLLYFSIWALIIYLLSEWREERLKWTIYLILLVVAIFGYFVLYRKIVILIKKRWDDDYIGELSELDHENYKKYLMASCKCFGVPITIDWKDVSFNDNKVTFNVSGLGEIYTFDCECTSKYNKYIPILKNRFPELKVKFINEQISLCDSNIFIEVIEIIVSYIAEEKERLEAIIIANPYLRESIEKRNIIKNEIKKSRSEYLNYLYEHQAQDKIIVKTYERPIYANQSNLPYERAYIFTIEKCKGEYCIIFENTNDYARASIVLEADDETYAECLKAIYDFMRCPKTLNKREKLQKEKKVDEFVSHSISHKDIVSWQNKILGYKKSRTKIRKYRKRYRRWY